MLIHVCRHIWFFLIILLTGCAGAPIQKHYNLSNPYKRIAVMPLSNQTNDVKGAEVMRSMLGEAFGHRGYNVKSFKDTDEILRDRMGITLGDQLDLTTPQAIGMELGVDAVVYGTLMDFTEITIGVYNARKVRGKFRFLNTTNGEIIWQGGLGVKSEMFTADAAGGALAVAANIKDANDKEAPWIILESIPLKLNAGETMALGLGGKLLTKMLGIHLEREARELAVRVTADLPWGPGPIADKDGLNKKGGE